MLIKNKELMNEISAFIEEKVNSSSERIDEQKGKCLESFFEENKFIGLDYEHNYYATWAAGFAGNRIKLKFWNAKYSKNIELGLVFDELESKSEKTVIFFPWYETENSEEGPELVVSHLEELIEEDEVLKKVVLHMNYEMIEEYLNSIQFSEAFGELFYKKVREATFEATLMVRLYHVFEVKTELIEICDGLWKVRLGDEEIAVYNPVDISFMF